MNLHASLLLNEALQWHQHVSIEADMLFHWWILHRGLAPQNKPELQKVLEKRKRDQVLKQQKEEQEAHKKRSDLEIELMKRQQKLEQVNDWWTLCHLHAHKSQRVQWLFQNFIWVAKLSVCVLEKLEFRVNVNVNLMSLFLQLELEQQKIEEEQENTPEFVKMKSNLRRTKQETDGEERTT